MRKSLLTFLVALLATPYLHAQDSPILEAQLKVSGACGMCKKRIEKTVNIKEVRYKKWDKSTQILTLAYQSESITLDSLQRRLAAAGHDTERYKAADSVYASLPECCLYRRNADNTGNELDPGRTDR